MDRKREQYIILQSPSILQEVWAVAEHTDDYEMRKEMFRMRVSKTMHNTNLKEQKRDTEADEKLVIPC